jgi:tetratricopeptide (TPR) repeat protein
LELGLTHNILGNFDQALEDLRAASERNPDSIKIRTMLIEQLLVLGRLSEALDLVGSPDIADPQQHPLLLAKVWAYWRLNQEDEAGAILNSLLQAGSAAATDRATLAGLLMALTADFGGEPVCLRRAALLVESYRTHNVLGQLGAGLVAAIAGLVGADADHRIMRQWASIWKEAAGSYVELELPLRLLEAAVEYQESGDDRVLLALPLEEREILHSMIGFIKPIRGARERVRTHEGSKKRSSRRKH